jgi:hypothetical protein
MQRRALTRNDRINTKEWQRLQSAVTLRTPAKKSARHILLITFLRSEVTAGSPQMGQKRTTRGLGELLSGRVA